jgi:hypothetical protein
MSVMYISVSRICLKITNLPEKILLFLAEKKTIKNYFGKFIEITQDIIGFGGNSNFVISKNSFYRFLRSNKFRRTTVRRDFMAVQIKKFVRPLFHRSFEVRDFSS